MIPGRRATRVLVVDVCGTLYDANTTAEYCMYHSRSLGGVLRTSVLHAITGERSPARLGLSGLHSATGIDLHRWLTLRSLRGQELSALQMSAGSYVDALQSKRIMPIHDLVSKLRDTHDVAILVSNGLDIVVGEIARRMALPYLASELEFQGTFCRGTLREDLYGRKLQSLEDWLGEGASNFNTTVVTDNKSDMDLIAVADNVYIPYSGYRKSWMEAVDANFIPY